MDRAAAIAKLKEHEAELKQLGIEHLYLFGSTARGDAREDSDVDLFFDHALGSLGLFQLMDVKDGARADVGATRSPIAPAERPADRKFVMPLGQNTGLPTRLSLVSLASLVAT